MRSSCFPLHKTENFSGLEDPTTTHRENENPFHNSGQLQNTGVYLLKDWIPQDFRSQEDRQKSLCFHIC